MTGETQWFYALDAERIGPVGESSLRTMLQSGKVNGDTLVWTGGMPDWVPLSQTTMAGATPPTIGAASPSPSPSDEFGPGRPMSFGEAIRSVLTKYATFSGRASRSEIWYFVLFYFLAVVGLQMLGGGMLVGVLQLGLIIPSLAVQVRRLHDIDRTGWWLLIGFLPLIGVIVLIVFMCTAPASGRNRFG
jgi:uncharacterized membrane protein YhaH (DUF805 family)